MRDNMWYERVATCFFISNTRARLKFPRVSEVVWLNKSKGWNKKI